MTNDGPTASPTEVLVNGQRREVRAEQDTALLYVLRNHLGLKGTRFGCGIGAKIGAAASFHGGRIAVADDPASPHLAADRITATVYVAGAVEDRSFTPEQAELLDSALTAAGVDHTVEFYPAHHGFAVPDNDTYDPAASARHWEALKSQLG